SPDPRDPPGRLRPPARAPAHPGIARARPSPGAAGRPCVRPDRRHHPSVLPTATARPDHSGSPFRAARIRLALTPTPPGVAALTEYGREPSGEPSSADVRLSRACSSVRFMQSKIYEATVSHVGRRQGSRSHREGRGALWPWRLANKP